MLRAFLRLTLPLICLLGVPAMAGAVSLRDVVELTRAGLDDEVIVALIQTDRTVYGIDARKLIDLKKDGVSERVLLALLRNGRELDGPDGSAVSAAMPPEQMAPVTPEPAPPQVIVIDHAEPAVIVPYYVQFPIFSTRPGLQRHRPRVVNQQPFLADTQGGFGRFINDGYRPAGLPASAPPVNFGRFINDGSRQSAGR